MKSILSKRKFQMAWGIFMIVAMLSCNLSGVGAPKPGKNSKINSTNTGPSGNASANPSGAGQTDDGKLEMRPADAPAAPSTPAWQPQLGTAVLTKPLTAGQAQTVDVEGKLTLNFPAGAFTETPPDLVVSPVSGEIPVPLKGDEALQAYDVSLGDLHSLAEPLQVSMSYDPARLKAGLPADAQLGAALWDKASGQWFGLSSSIDESAHTVNFETDHLSILVIYLNTWVNDYCRTAHFNVLYDRDNIDTGSGAMTYASTGQPCRESSNKKPLPAFVAAVTDYLEAAYQGYNAENYTIEPPQGGSIVAYAVFLGDKSLFSTTSQYDTLTGSLVLTTNSWPKPAELRQDCAHELFHLWQYKHTGLGQFGLNMAWMDATADYAADKVAYASSSYGPTNSMGLNIRANFLEGSLTSNADYHGYSSAHFVDFLVNQSGYFPTLADLWKASMSSALSSPMENLKTWLKDTMNTEFADLYKDFANYMLFTDSSKLPIKSPVWSSAASNDGMIYDQTGNVDAAATAKPYASVMYGLKVRESKFMSVTWTNPNDGHVYVFFDEDGDQRSGNRAGYFLYANKTASFPMTDQTTVFIFMVNPTSGGLDFNLTIGAAEADVYSVSIAYDKTDATCVENSAWGTPTSTLEIKDDNSKVTIHYDSATDDYYWAEGAEHTMVATGSGSFVNAKLEAEPGIDRYDQAGR